ncbi:hypothetical protein DIPPA_21062 [Diplonema papillatum]|nr:hypothetical protein DIPPA_21062 [Diplonema papillatum]
MAGTWEKDTEQSFLQQFEEQVEGESDDGWQQNYAHARELLVSSRFAGATEACEYESDEDMPILLQDKWQSNDRCVTRGGRSGREPKPSPQQKS